MRKAAICCLKLCSRAVCASGLSSSKFSLNPFSYCSAFLILFGDMPYVERAGANIAVQRVRIIVCSSDCTLDVLLALDTRFDFHVSLRSELHGNQIWYAKDHVVPDAAYIEEENQHYRSQYNSRTPRILSPASCHTNTSLRTDLMVCRVEQMYDGRGHDDTSSEISSRKINAEWYAEPWYPFCQYRKEGCEAGGDHDDE